MNAAGIIWMWWDIDSLWRYFFFVTIAHPIANPERRTCDGMREREIPNCNTALPILSGDPSPVDATGHQWFRMTVDKEGEEVY